MLLTRHMLPVSIGVSFSRSSRPRHPVSGQYERINGTSFEIKQKDLMTGEEKKMNSAPFSTAAAA
jgi:hypothetical protein